MSKIFVDIWEDDEDDNTDATKPYQLPTTELENQYPENSVDVTLWTMPEVIDWVTRIGYSAFVDRFIEKGVDGDMLFSLKDNELRFSIGIDNSLLLQRFIREVKNLKQLTSFSSQDHTNLRSFLMSIDPKFSEYTHSMLQAGVDMNCLTLLSDDMLASEIGILNSIHRRKIMQAISERLLRGEHANEKLDGFISYRRSNGSEFASLLYFKLERLGHSIFLDTERLGPGKFDNNLKQNIKRAKNFLLVLTQNSLDRCIGDNDCNDWVHKEIVTAIEYNCYIILIMDNFHWPDVSTLPEDMQIIAKCKSITWEHEHADESVYKVHKFMWSNNLELDVTRLERSMSLSLQGESNPNWQEAIKTIKSAPCTPVNMRKLKIRNNSEKDLSNRFENCSLKNRSGSLPKLPSDDSDLPSCANTYQEIKSIEDVLPSNTFKDDLKTDECVEIRKDISQRDNTITNRNTNNVSNVVKNLIRKIIPFTKTHP